MTDQQTIRIRWAPCVPQDKIKRFYEQEAKGILDEALIDDVGIALELRCESIRRVTERCCPLCGTPLHDPGPPTLKNRIVSCAQCQWEATWHQYHVSYKPHRLHGGRAYPAFLKYLQEYPNCQTPQQKILCIDRLVHAIHGPGSPGGQNVIEGTFTAVRKFLDELAYSDTARSIRPGIRDDYEKSMVEGDIAGAIFWEMKSRKAGRKS